MSLLMSRAVVGALLVNVALAANLSAAERAELDVTATLPPSRLAQSHLAQLRGDPAMRRMGTLASVDERYGVPTFVWADRSAPRTSTAPSMGRLSSEQAARAHASTIAPLYRLDRADLESARLRHVHDVGSGGIIATFDQVVDGIEVFRDELRILMDRNRNLVAAAGYIPSRTLSTRSGARTFRLTPTNAIAAALRDFSGASAAPRRTAAAPGGYETFDAGVAGIQPVRAKRVLFHLPDELRPAYYIEVMDETDAYSYVVSADDGAVLFRHNLTASDSYSYRVWANTAAPNIPFDAPAGDSPSPHPTGTLNNFNPPYVAPNLLNLQNGPISTNDPWLPPAATETFGNNVEAFVDLVTPDGFSAGDFRASTTAPGTFDRTFDPTQDPAASANQRMAAITQLFYTTNFLHDWFYDEGFDEASGNAQDDNYGRGGIQGDRMRAEAQDFQGFNNANMNTPADGGRPRMQMYIFNSPAAARVTITAPAAIAGDYAAGTANFGPQSFNVSGDVVLVQDTAAPTGDGCTAIVNAIAGKIALIDRGTCGFIDKPLNAQAAGAIGVIIANNAAGVPPGMTGVGAVTIPVLSVTQATGNAIKAQLAGGTVTATLLRQANRDGTVDNQIVAHEWGHYISNRLIGNANGLTTQQSAGMGEGWGDVHALLLTVREGDDLVLNNANFNGIYAPFAYSIHAPLIPANAYYFGFRRYPYSTDLTKNPLTFRHIQAGVALPVGPPVAFGADGSGNAEVHNTGEVWASMMWECYAALLRDTGRLTFAQAQQRMQSYLVAGYKMTPNQPTFTEARDAVLAAAFANDVTDFNLFCAAFAKRGAGTGAVSPDRFSTTNVGVIESFACGGDLALVSAEIVDDIYTCDSDGYLDNAETGHVLLTLRNSGATNLSSTSATVSSTNGSVSFPAGNSVSFVATSPYGVMTTSVPIRMTGAVGTQVIDLSISYNDPGLLTAGPRIASLDVYGNVDETPSLVETVEESNTTCTTDGNPALADQPWRRIQITPTTHRFFVPDWGALSDQSLVTPPIQVAPAGAFSFQFSHSFSFETGLPTFYDGGVIELSTNGGGTWTDIGASASPGYGGTIFVGANNPLSGRSAYVGTNASYPNLDLVTVNLGTTYAGQTVLVRFRFGADEAADGPGWQLDNLQFFNITNTPFVGIVTETGPCMPLATDGRLPTELAFAVAGSNPVRGEARFRFELPEPARVEIAIYDIAGRRLATLADADYAAGNHSATWSGPRESAKAGVYFARMTANGREFKRRLIVVP